MKSSLYLGYEVSAMEYECGFLYSQIYNENSGSIKVKSLSGSQEGFLEGRLSISCRCLRELNT